MIKEELEIYKDAIIKEIQNIEEIEALRTIKRALEKYKFIRDQPLNEYDDNVTNNLHYYTEEEMKENLVAAFQAYQQGDYFVDEDPTGISIKWSITANNDLNENKKQLKFPSQLRNTFEILSYNPKSGKKIKKYANILDGTIRTAQINKDCYLHYIIESSNCFLVLAIENIPTSKDKELLKSSSDN